ncbi:MAG TPA: cyclic pyranopterin monophosphate synthase MoaC, partial [Methanoregulaceae archaeon]|nr:cyclic pyranopterin monophosphate synthase MoaC [Methanoregulaceae archaeon]
MVKFTHIQNDRAQMVDISAKRDVTREATAAGKIFLRPTTLAAIREGTVVKGNVLATARVAATLAVKNTAGIIPMCHPIPISS